MCGISVLIDPGASLTFEDLDKMTRVIRHRGPDDGGYALFAADGTLLGEVFDPDSALALKDIPPVCMSPGSGGVMLGHRRLAILDLSPAGHQPMTTSDRLYWIVYNGEVYNYRELRDELEALGHAFQTETDTEVVLHAYAEWGRDCLDRFNGMFAFAILDRESRTVFAARDRFGVKPLYYWYSPAGFLAFASEIKQFTALPGWEARLNRQRAFDFLAYALVDHTRETLFDGVCQLRGGEAVEVDLAGSGIFEPFTYYTLEPVTTESSFSRACERFRALFFDAVRLRLRADVPVGSCLSGGLDSSSIVCAVDSLLGAGRGERMQQTFSACSVNPRYDERRFMEEVVSGRAIEANYEYPSIDRFLEEMDHLVWHQDEPFVSTSMYAQWNVFRLAADSGIRVMLDGQGADEQLCGYHAFFPVRYADLLRSGAWLRCLGEIRQAGDLFASPMRQTLLETVFYLVPDRLRRFVQRRMYAPTIFPPWINGERLENPRTIESSVPAVHTVADLTLIQLLYTSLPALLHWEDRNSMAHSVESRVPFLDYRIVEFVTGLPTEYRLKDCETKRVLREGMRGVLPETIRARRDKMGFTTAEEEWVTGTDAGRLRELVVQAIAMSGGIISSRALDQFDEIVQGRRPYSPDIWRWITFSRWMKIFGVALGEAGAR